MVYGDERSSSHKYNMIGLGEKFDLDHVLLLTGDDGKFSYMEHQDVDTLPIMALGYA